jgi:hypothetical protein
MDTRPLLGITLPLIPTLAIDHQKTTVKSFIVLGTEYVPTSNQAGIFMHANAMADQEPGKCRQINLFRPK